MKSKEKQEKQRKAKKSKEKLEKQISLEKQRKANKWDIFPIFISGTFFPLEEKFVTTRRTTTLVFLGPLRVSSRSKIQSV